MKRFLVVFFLSLLQALPSQADLKMKSRLKVVALSPTLVELLYALDYGSQVIGAVEFSDFPIEAKSITRVGDYTKPSLEKILSLKPDVVFVQDEGEDTVSVALRRTGLKHHVFRMKALGDFDITTHRMAEILSEMTGDARVKTTAERLVRNFKRGIERLKSRQQVFKTLIQVDHDPLMVAGANSFLTEVAALCGVENVVKQNGYPQLNTEALLNLKPEVVVVTAHSKTQDFEKTVKTYWENVKLEKKPQLLFVDPDTLSRLGPRLPAAASSLCDKLSELPHSRKP